MRIRQNYGQVWGVRKKWGECSSSAVRKKWLITFTSVSLMTDLTHGKSFNYFQIFVFAFHQSGILVMRNTIFLWNFFFIYRLRRYVFPQGYSLPVVFFLTLDIFILLHFQKKSLTKVEMHLKVLFLFYPLCFYFLFCNFTLQKFWW